jgi:2-polyprenyl-3-methyl-5-hydroxy-6-metoxy-1,4-benzoquinol methylase
MKSIESEISTGERFKFGENWRRFLSGLNERKIVAAINHVAKALDMASLSGKTFLDVGSGSGLTSLAATRLGANTTSFDFDPESVACTRELRRIYTNQSERWNISEGSALDKSFLDQLGKFDIVCSWGVLHHTGSMWEAMENMVPLVKDGGLLYIAIYNDQGNWSKRWIAIKRIYNRLPGPLAAVFATLVMGPREVRIALGRLRRLKFIEYFRSWKNYEGDSLRGMSRYYDIIDWVGGYPFEVAKPEEVFDFYRRRGFVLTKLVTCGGGLGCNHFIFERHSAA